MSKRLAHRIAALAAVPLVIGMFAGCAAAGGSDEPSPSGSNGAKYSSYEDWHIAYADCMRGEGQQVSDTQDPSKSVAMTPAYEAADKECEVKLGPAPGKDGKDAADSNNDEMLAVAKCFRDAGLDVPDPKPGQGGVIPSGAPKDVIDKCLAAGGDGGNDSGAQTK
jgi:hypothetical protein